MFGEAWSPMSVPDLAPDDDDDGLGKVRVNCFPKTITTWFGWESNPPPPDTESYALTTLPRCPSPCPSSCSFSYSSFFPSSFSLSSCSSSPSSCCSFFLPPPASPPALLPSPFPILPPEPRSLDMLLVLGDFEFC